MEIPHRGIANNFKSGFRISCNRSKIPELLSALIARNKPTRVGKIFITVSIPTFCTVLKNYQKLSLFLQNHKEQ